MPQSDPSRTEKPTSKRVTDARKKGNVAKSPEVGSTMTILAGSVVAYFWIAYVGKEMMNVYRYFLSTAIISFDPTPNEVRALALSITLSIAKMVLPIMFTVGFFVFLAQRIQVGKLWTTTPMKPDLKKMNPISGMKRMFISLQMLMRMGMNILKAVVIGAAPAIVVIDEIPNFMSLYYVDATTLSVYILKLGFKMVIYALVPMIIIAVAHLAYSRWDYTENLKMTKFEVKDEAKQMDGDPAVKSKMRQKMMQIMQRRMMKEVPKADVVITNPTHIAVAIKYSAMEAPAPIVVAKGADKVAEKIKAIAREHKVPIRENVALARALYKQAEVGEMIPEDMYKAVATILAQIWQQKGLRMGAGPGQSAR